MNSFYFLFNKFDSSLFYLWVKETGKQGNEFENAPYNRYPFWKWFSNFVNSDFPFNICITIKDNLTYENYEKAWIVTNLESWENSTNFQFKPKIIHPILFHDIFITDSYLVWIFFHFYWLFDFPILLDLFFKMSFLLWVQNGVSRPTIGRSFLRKIKMIRDV